MAGVWSLPRLQDTNLTSVIPAVPPNVVSLKKGNIDILNTDTNTCCFSLDFCIMSVKEPLHFLQNNQGMHINLHITSLHSFYTQNDPLCIC